MPLLMLLFLSVLLRWTTPLSGLAGGVLGLTATEPPGAVLIVAGVMLLA